jgi:hypothetical protein
MPPELLAVFELRTNSTPGMFVLRTHWPQVSNIHMPPIYATDICHATLPYHYAAYPGKRVGTAAATKPAASAAAREASIAAAASHWTLHEQTNHS